MENELEENDLVDIQERLWDARSKWRKIGLTLKIKPSDLEVIEKDGSDTDDRFEKMILRWLRNGEKCTWDALCQALSARSVNCCDLADRIRGEKCDTGQVKEHIELLGETSFSLDQITAPIAKPSVQPVQHKLINCVKEPEPECGSESSPASMSKELCLKEGMKLRGYQVELADPGLNGKNYVLVAPTGTGKTLIAAYIIMHHLKQLQEEGRKGKVVFVTPTRQLTFQQKKQLQQYIPGIMAVDITGASGHPMQPLIQSELVDVIVCTAGKLRQELKIDATPINITDFSLIIADECHHAGRPSNYTDIMEFYIRAKHSAASCHLPQLVGMTASPGAGKGRANPTTVREHHISLCSTLDATAGIVITKKYVDELEAFQNDPKSHLIVADERSANHEFVGAMNAAMKQLESAIGSNPGFERGSSQYESWLQNEKEAAENREKDETARISILDQLFAYSQALKTYHNFQYDDAVSVLENIEEYPHQSQLEQILTAVQRQLLENLRAIPRMPNPLLVHTEQVLLEQYSKQPESKGIFFVSAVKYTNYVENWINSSPTLSRIIRVARISGHSHGGMEKSEQLRVLEGFRNGTYNLLASTAVLEEGLDVPECNFIVRYQNISNEIAQVQAKGRARAENSKIYTVVSANSKQGYWYLVQEEKQRTINESIAALQQCELGPDISHEQISFIRDRDRKAQMMKALRGKWPEAQRVEIRCKKCNVLACKGSDVFMYTLSCADPQYIVPSEAFSEKYEKLDHDKPEVSDAFVKPYKMYCRSQSCRSQWGIIGLWRDTEYKFPVLKCEKFLFKYDGGATKTFRKWKEIWFDVKSIQDWVEFEDDVNI